MKTHLFKTALVSLSLCSGAVGGAPKTVDTVLVEKQKVFVQTDASTTMQTGWVGSIRIEGKGTVPDNLASISAPSYTTPAGSGVSSATFGGADYSASQDSWHVTNSYVDQTALDAAFNNGTYTVTVKATTLTLNLSGDSYPDPTPVGTASAGTWTGGILYVDPTLALTITLNSVNFGVGNGHVGINLNGNYTGDIKYENFGSGSMSGGYIDIPASTFISGESYTVEMQFNSLADQDIVNNPNAPGTISTNAAIYTNLTSFTIIAIPEPATYALFAGALALTGVLLARRRR